ncbi:MAG: hypothetical protein IKO06_04625 [Alphaproteobacteria bacterium]|nr:hypothetical protein [Alphaproteobacteria bacterium]
MSEELGYWEKTWNLPLLDQPVSSWPGQRLSGGVDVGTSIIHKLIKENPGKAFEIAQHAMQIDGFGSVSGIVSHAACCNDKALESMLNYLENGGSSLSDIVSHGTLNDGYCSGDEKNKPTYLEWWKNDYMDIPDISSVLIKAMNDGKIEPSRLFEIFRKKSRFINNQEYEFYLKTYYKPEPSIRGGDIRESLDADDEKTLQKLMADCVVKDPKLWDKYFAHVKATMKMNVFVGEEIDLIKCCNAVASYNTTLPKSFCDDVEDIARKVDWHSRKGLKPALERIAENDLSYYYKNRDLYSSQISQQVALKDHSLIPSLESIYRENFDAFAQIYEDEYASKTYNVDEDNLKQKNVVLEKENKEIMDTIKTKILDIGGGYHDSISIPVQAWLVKNAKKYPNLVSDCLKTVDLPYVEMCIKYIENPEKENIASLLNRLEVTDAKTFADFQDARDFVARRDLCKKACNAFAKDVLNEVGDVALSSSPIPMMFGARMGTTKVDGRLSYDMAEAGIDDFKTAKRVAKLFYALNGRPAIYGSDYNPYYPHSLLPIAKSNVMQDWMYPVMLEAIENEALSTSEGRIPSERTLFDCCKAWKINPAMPQRLAKFVGTHSLKGRMLAGAIFGKMVEEGKTTPEEWRDNKVLHEKFYEELARAEKMPMTDAFRQYIPNTPVNRKRLVGMGMEEKGIENTPENFKTLYRQMREQGVFEKVLAKPEEARTTFSSRLLVETARRKFDKTR